MGAVIMLLLSFTVASAQESNETMSSDKVYEDTMKRSEKEAYERQKKMMELRQRAELEKLKFKLKENSNEDQ